MQKVFYNNYYTQPKSNIQYDERFIGPIFPFLGGALIGYIAGRPQYNYSYPMYYPYPIYYPYYPNYYQRIDNYNSNFNSSNNMY